MKECLYDRYDECFGTCPDCPYADEQVDGGGYDDYDSVRDYRLECIDNEDA